METIIILPKNVTVTMLLDTNEVEIKINKQTMLNNGKLLMEQFYDELNDIVTCNEINPSTDTWLISDNDIYLLTPNNIKELENKGETVLVFQGKLKDNIDLNVDSDNEFIKWYYSTDTVEEAIEIMNQN